MKNEAIANAIATIQSIAGLSYASTPADIIDMARAANAELQEAGIYRATDLNKPTDNISLVASCMEFSDHGAMAQMFIIEAIRRYAKAITETDIEKLRESFKDSMVSADAWQGTAKEIETKFNKFYGRHDAQA